MAAVPARHWREPSAYEVGRHTALVATTPDTLLGTEDWYEEFYRVESDPGLFAGAEDRVVKATTETIGRYFNKRLKSVFAAVAESPKVLRNKAQCPLYLLCFAVGNRRGAPIALRIANHLLTKGVL